MNGKVYYSFSCNACIIKFKYEYCVDNKFSSIIKQNKKKSYEYHTRNDNVLESFCLQKLKVINIKKIKHLIIHYL